LSEWDWDVAKKVWKEEAKEEGVEEGLEMGVEKTLSLMRQGYTAEQIETMLSRKKDDAAGLPRLR
jgi:flagellar biosynthesis/type III secretory pathway protein FliH